MISGLGAIRQIETGPLSICVHESGPSKGFPVVLLHGFPYDVQAYAEVAPILAQQGCRVIVPYLRGFGPTRFLSPDSLRSGEQAALGADLLALLDAMSVSRAIVAGYDWGSTAACVVAALWPERYVGLVSFNSYKIQDIANARRPSTPENEMRYWYQYYFHGERGRAGLELNRQAFCRLLWRLWSPDWEFEDECFARSAVSFGNPDFVDVVIHSYRHQYGLVDGDPAYSELQQRLSRLPPILVPTITMDGTHDGVIPPEGTSAHAKYFTGYHDHRMVEGAGHNLPQEKPMVFARAVLDLLSLVRRLKV
jgi:pimeloyl-ACP methyl ester carboxylesterase